LTEAWEPRSRSTSSLRKITGVRMAVLNKIGDRFKDIEKKLKNNTDVLNLTQKAIVKEIHVAYLDAGADIVETNTFNG
jgi:5-methyltetrahydrofolate--homocysteine methyltransferase